MSRPPRILAVDDDPANVRLLEAVLEPEGYEVLGKGSGEEALRAVAAAEPDVVVLDILMPGMDGYEVCRRLRAQEATEALPILLITAGGEQQKVGALEAGADDFIAKPFDRAELLARVRSLLRIKRYQDTVRAQAAELAELNRTLEARVDEQVGTIERLGGLRRFLPRQLADLIVSAGDEAILESHRAEIALICARLRGFPAFSESAEPEEVMDVLREFHEGVGSLIEQAAATVGSLTGDGLVVYLNDPLTVDEPAWRAVGLAVAMRDLVGRLAAGWRRRGHELSFAAGVALGYATVGRMGLEGRWEYGPVGPVVHLAEQLAATARPGQVLVSARCHAQVETRVAAEPVDDVFLDGAAARVSAVAVLAIQGGLTAPGELTPREVEVLRLVTDGLSNRAIAGRLVISEKTVIRHVSNIFMKLDVHNRTEAARLAVERGLLL
jgi:DNA-binding NarL/FixJ family response regulator